MRILLYPAQRATDLTSEAVQVVQSVPVVQNVLNHLNSLNILNLNAVCHSAYCPPFGMAQGGEQFVES
jgi:hypothetical protein